MSGRGRLGLALGLSLLAGCGTHPASDSPPAAAEDSLPVASTDAERMLAQTLAGTPVAASVMRDGQRLSYSVQLPATDAASASSAQLDATCDGASARLIYLDGAQRVYLGSPNGQYAPATSIPAKYLPLLKANPAFARACASTPAEDWRVAHGKGAESLILLDRASLKTENNLQQFWGAYDEPVLGHDQPYAAPVAQKREHYSVDCGQQRFSLLAAYDLDDKRTVTDGVVFDDPKPEPMTGAHADYRLLFDLVCKHPEKIAQLPAFTARALAPSDLTPPGVAPAVITAVKRVALPSSPKALKQVLEVGTSSLKGQAGELREDVFFEQDKATGQLLSRVRGQGYEGSSVTFRGLFPLAEKTRFQSGGQAVTNIQHLLSLSFSGNWQQMPVGEQLQYTSLGETVSSLAGSSGKTSTLVRCAVDADVPASSLNAALSGTARKLRCSTDGDEYKRVETVFYLMDYGWFFKAGVDPNGFYSEQRTLQVVE
jgi:hypothetical protein